MEKIILCGIAIVIFLQLIQLFKGNNSPKKDDKKAPFTGKRTCKVILRTPVGESDYAILQDITHPEDSTVFVLNGNDINNTEDTGSSVGCSYLKVDGVYFISDEPLTEIQKGIKGKYFASRIN